MVVNRLLVVASEGLDRSPVLADRQQYSVRLEVGAQNVRQDRGVAGVGFAADLSVAFAVRATARGLIG